MPAKEDVSPDDQAPSGDYVVEEQDAQEIHEEDDGKSAAEE